MLKDPEIEFRFLSKLMGFVLPNRVSKFMPLLKSSNMRLKVLDYLIRSYIKAKLTLSLVEDNQDTLISVIYLVTRSTKGALALRN